VNDCGKEAYGSKAAARRVANYCFKARGADLRAYQCPQCRKWHLTKERADRTPRDWK